MAKGKLSVDELARRLRNECWRTLESPDPISKERWAKGEKSAYKEQWKNVALLAIKLLAGPVSEPKQRKPGTLVCGVCGIPKTSNWQAWAEALIRHVRRERAELARAKAAKKARRR